MNYDRVSATIGTRAVDLRKLADDKFNKRMGNFDRVFKQIDVKHDHVMEMLANIQEQLRMLEMKQRKGRDAQIQSQMAAIKPPYLSVSRPQQIEVESRILPPNQHLSSSSYAWNDAKLENEGCVEVLKHAPTISAVVVETVETDFFTTRAAKIHARKVFDEIPESKKSKISVMPPFVLGSEVAEVCDFSVSNPQSQMPLVSTQEIKMELDCLSLIPSPSSFSPSSNGTKLEDEGFFELPIHITVTESQLQESESEFEWSENSPVFSLPEFIPSWKIMVSSLLHLPLLYKCYGVEVLTKEELIWFDTGQHRITSGLSRERVTSNFIVSWKLMNAMYWDRNRLVAEMQLKGLKLVLLTIEVGKHLVEMKSFVIKSDIITYSTLLLVLSDASKMSEAKSMLKEILGESFHHDLRLAEQNKKRIVVVLQSGFGSEYDSINIGDSVSYPTAGSGGNSNKGPCAEKSIEKPRSSGWWFVEDGLLNLDENEELVTNFEFRLFELEVVDVLVYVVANGHQDDSALFGENGAVAALPSGATIGDKHYVADVFLVPSVETNFARAASSCYRFSNLLNRVEEKTGGRITTSNMESIYIQFIRKGGLRELIPTELTGKRFLCCSGASIFSPRVGINPKAPVLSCAMIFFMERVGEAHEGWEFDQSLTSSLRWITLETGHVIPTLVADKESILVPMCERPSRKPPFLLRLTSLGDKTHSRGEYCHVHGYGELGLKEDEVK